MNKYINYLYRKFSFKEFYEERVVVHFVKCFTEVNKTQIDSRLASNVMINNISYTINSMTTTELLFKAKLQVRCLKIR